MNRYIVSIVVSRLDENHINQVYHMPFEVEAKSAIVAKALAREVYEKRFPPYKWRYSVHCCLTSGTTLITEKNVSNCVITTT